MNEQAPVIRCLIVDDSDTFRRVLKGILAQAPGVEVVGESDNGFDCVEMARRLRPDVVTMDVQMPGRNGLEAIREIMASKPVPIVVISSVARDEDLQVSFRALELGAIEVLEKPDALDRFKFEQQAEAIRLAVRAVHGLRLISRPSVPTQRPASTRGAAYQPKCLGIVASTGGPQALRCVLGALPKSFPVPILVVQHVASGIGESLVKWLSGCCAIDVRTAVRDEWLQPGRVSFAPPGQHMIVSLGRIRLDDGPPVKGAKPSGTVLLASLAREYGAAAAGVVLTGMGEDGAMGLKLIRDRGGLTIAQGEMSSTIYGMPRAAKESGAAGFIFELEEITPSLLRMIR